MRGIWRRDVRRRWIGGKGEAPPLSGSVRDWGQVPDHNKAWGEHARAICFGFWPKDGSVLSSAPPPPNSDHQDPGAITYGSRGGPRAFRQRRIHSVRCLTTTQGHPHTGYDGIRRGGLGLGRRGAGGVGRRADTGAVLRLHKRQVDSRPRPPGGPGSGLDEMLG